MKTDPENGRGDDLRQQEPPKASNGEVPPSPDTQQGSSGAEQRATEPAPPIGKRVWRRLTLGYGERWNFDDAPSIFDAMTTVVSIAGVILVYSQWQQTERALNIAEASLEDARAIRRSDEALAVERNRIDAETRSKERSDAEARSRRDERIAAANEVSASAARSAILAQRASQEAERRAWVKVENGEFVPGVSGLTEAYLRLVNEGTTAASNLRMRGAFREAVLYRNTSLAAADERLRQLKTFSLGSPAVLHPGMRVPYRFHHLDPRGPMILDMQLDALTADRIAGAAAPGIDGIGLVLDGEVFYHDIFKKGRRTRFCVVIDHERQTRLCPDNNYAE